MFDCIGNSWENEHNIKYNNAGGPAQLCEKVGINKTQIKRTDTTRELFLKRKLINYTKNELQGINILKLRLPNGLKCCFNFFIVGMGNNIK